MNGERPLFVFISNPKCDQDFNETILETLSMLKKALKILLNVFGNVNAAGRLVWGQSSILLVLFGKVVNKNLRMNTFRALNRDSSTLHVGKMPTENKNRYLDKLAV